MKTRSFIPCLFVLLAVSGCGGCEGCGPETGPTPPPSATTSPSGSANNPPSEAPAYVERQYVARVEGDCTSEPISAGKSGFKVTPLYPSSGPKLPDSMAKLCLFEWVGPTNPTATEVLGAASARGARLDPDPPVVVSVGSRDPGWPTRATKLRQRFDVQLGLTDKQGARIKLPVPAGFKPVFIGVPDSSPPAEDPNVIAPGINPHGFNVAWTAKLVSCVDGSGDTCLGAPRTELALGCQDGVAGGPPTCNANGGTFGTRTALARAIVNLVARQAAEQAAGKVEHMVLNLSIGWEDRFDCALTKVKGASESPGCPKGQALTMNEGATAVLEALDYASCSGAAIIAAAGNDPGLTPTPRGPILPAAWEGKAAPSAAYCTCKFVDHGACADVPRADPESKRPLLHAVGAVTPTDVPIATSRAESTPRFVAPGSLVVTFPGDAINAAEPRYPLSGTSMAAAAMSGAVAALWAERPKLDAEAVIEAVYDSAALLGAAPGIEADFCLAKPPGATSGGSCGPVRRVALCDAIKKHVPAGAKLDCADASSRRPDGVIPIVPAVGVQPQPIDITNLLGVTYGQPIVPICPDCSFQLANPGEYVTSEASIVTNDWFGLNQATLLTLGGLTRPLGMRFYGPTGARVDVSSSSLTPNTIRPSTDPNARTKVDGRATPKAPIQTATITYQVTYKSGATVLVTEEAVVE